jgi:SpoVK/Ycf46/Vps4 family AAA+-type ATPase
VQAEKMAKLHPSRGRERVPARASAPAVDVEDDYESQILDLRRETEVSWEDIGGLEDTKRAIKMAYGLAVAQKPANVRIDPSRNIMFYGPPGTGKTLLAAATAGSLEAAFFNVKVSSILSKYFGESPRLISALFSVARRNSPAVIFIDEFESLTPPRGSGESGPERRVISTMLAELDGLASKGDDAFVLTIGATNEPWLLDEAVLSRFQQAIYIPLPDPASRRAILEIQIDKNGFSSQVPLDVLVERTDGYAGREIAFLVRDAVDRMLDRANPSLLTLVEKGEKAVSGYKLKKVPLGEADFDAAFQRVRPNTDPAKIARFKAWARRNG